MRRDARLAGAKPNCCQRSMHAAVRASRQSHFGLDHRLEAHSPAKLSLSKQHLSLQHRINIRHHV